MSKRAPASTVTSQAALAKALTAKGHAITQQALSKRIQSGDFPKGPPWDVDACLAALADDGSPAGAMAKAKLDLLVKRAAKLEIENTLALGGYLKREDVERGRVERVQAVRRELANIRLLALKLDGKSVPAMELVLEQWARDVCRKFERGDG